MHRKTFEIKARCTDLAHIRKILVSSHARFISSDRQVDTYFRIPHGRMKLREGDIERCLIHYSRPDEIGPKSSDVVLCPMTEHLPALKEILSRALGVDVVVEKHREIYFIENTKFHLDWIDGMGTFVEIEAIDEDGSIGQDSLRKQCEGYIHLFGLTEQDFLAGSYSDMIREGTLDQAQVTSIR